MEVKLHEFREGTQHQKSYFIELWDIGGSSNHRNTRSVFYNAIHGKDIFIPLIYITLFLLSFTLKHKGVFVMNNLTIIII